ncbi:hypothetical protein T484DRAFT_1752135 [Baffinella frigidus]|nr:hypothetical protein T484DRAFT_1752135 [Cryptophyta sp. CCMP2293]
MEGLRDWHALRAGGHTGLHGGALWGAPSSHTASGRCGAAARAGGGSRTAEAFEARARRAFERYDAEGSGSLTREGVKLAFMELLGYRPSPPILRQRGSRLPHLVLAWGICRAMAWKARQPHAACAGRYKPTRYELAVLFGHAHTPTLAASFPPTSSYSRSGAAGGGAHGAGEDAGPATGGYAVGWEEFLAAVRQRAEVPHPKHLSCPFVRRTNERQR